MLAVTCVPPGPLSTFAPVLTAGVEAEVETFVWDGVTFTLADVEAGGAVVPVDTEAAGGAVWALTVADVEAAGVLTLAFTVAAGAGAGVVDVATEAVTGTLGVEGAPGRPPA